MHTTSLQRRRTSPNEYPGYDIKQSYGEAPVMRELMGMQSTPLLSLLPIPLSPGVITPDRFLSMSLIELFDHLTECKQTTEV